MKSNFEVQSSILGLEDINLSTKIFLYFLSVKYMTSKDNNIEIKNEEIKVVIGYEEKLTLEVIMNLKLRGYIKTHKNDSKKVSLTIKTLNHINKLKID